MKLQEEFDRERDRLVRERHEIRIAGGVGGVVGGVGGVGGVAGILLGAGGLGGRLGPNDDDNVGFSTEHMVKISTLYFKLVFHINLWYF